MVELMAVVIIVGLMAGAAVVFINPTKVAATARGYAHEVTGMCDAARQRAIATHTYQRITVAADEISHYQGATSGMAVPDSWNLITTLEVPDQVTVASFDDATHVTDDTDVPEVGAGLPATIDFSPDGSASSATIFVTDSADDKRARVAIYRASGSVYTYQDW
jgi:Tfp pilus assembly protein FimT